MKSNVDKMLVKHDQLIHSEGVKVCSHTQRMKDDWVLHTIMIDNCDTPFTFKRTKKYKSLSGASVNMTYYADKQGIAGFEMDIFKVVRIKRS
ncbi:hypothetical protein MSG37_10925 [Shewanella sp. 1CM18E]|uniref:hypothetical protein n=1 Tax=Shewanella sp. 1CM18E TaxID=2929169 RepID=UPI0020BE7777|nr:hypothetical protein [Shewanella sp. 1CM18E]